MDFVSVAVAPLAKAILSQVGKEVGGAAAKGARALVWGDPEQKALERALGRAFAEGGKVHSERLADFDINAGFWHHEGAAELAKVLVAGSTPSAARLAQRAVDSLGRCRSDDERRDRILVLQPVFATVLENLRREVHAEPALFPALGHGDVARIAEGVTALADALGAGAASDDTQIRYLGWLIDRHRYVPTAGLVRNTTVQLPLDEVFVGLRARPDRRPGDRAWAWFDQQSRQLAALLEGGQLDHAGFEVALDRLQAQYGRPVAGGGDSASDQPVPVLDAVRDRSQVVVLGDPGSGKTTLLRYLALCHARAMFKGEAVHGRPARLPIYVQVSEYASHGYPRTGIGDFLPDQLTRAECPVPGVAHMLKQHLEAGRCLVLLDGLDEISSADLRRGVINAVGNFVAAHSRPGNRFVVTSRIAGYQAAPLPEPFTALRMQDMDDATISRFLQAYCRQVERFETPENSETAITEAGEREARAIEQALRSNAGVRRLAANPLLLTALVLVHRARGRLPHRRVEAYVEVCTALGRTWRSVQGVADADLPDEWILTRWLTALGAWMHEHRPEGAATRTELLQVLGPMWAADQGIAWDPDVLTAADPLGTAAGHGVLEFVDKADTHTGLLVERAPGRYGFAHLTFEEYYAGRALAFRGTATQRITAIRSRLHDPRYTEPILLALGLIGTDYTDQIDDVIAEAIYPGTQPSPYEELLGRDFLFMLRVLADGAPVQTVTIDAIVNQAIDERLDPEHSRCRFATYRTTLEQHLAALTSTKAAHRYITAVDTRTGSLTASTAQSWIELAGIAAHLGGLPAATVAALAHLAGSRDTEPSVRVKAGSVLAQADRLTEPVITALAELAVSSDTEPSVRVKAGSVLAQADRLTEPVITALTHLATSDTAPSIQVKAASVLAEGRALTEPVITSLAQLAVSDPDRGVEAVSALAKGEKLTESVIAVLTLLATGNFDSSVRLRAMSALAKDGVSNMPVIPAPPKLVGRWMRPAQPLMVVEALTAPVITALEQFALSSNTPTSLRTQAGQVLAERGALTEPVTTALTQIAVGNTYPSVRVTAGSVLAKAGTLPEPVITALTHLATSDTDPSMQVEAGSVLAEGGALTQPVITALTHLATSDTDPSMQVKAGSVLAEGGALTQPVITALTELTTSDTNPLTQVEAGSVLAKGRPLTEPVITALTHLATSSNSESYVQNIAASALANGERLTEPVITTLVRLATGKEKSWAKVRALETLRKAPPTPNLRGALIGLFGGDKSPSVRRSTAATLIEWSRRYPEHANEIRADLAHACNDPVLGTKDEYGSRTGWDYAYDGLRTLVEAPTYPPIGDQPATN